MNTEIVTIQKETNIPSVMPVEQDGIYMNSTIDTARAAAKYASQLSNEYHRILHRQLKKVAPELADRFTSLITELTTMTDVTYKNVRFHRK